MKTSDTTEPGALDWLVHHEEACVFYPDMRDEGKGYRDCPGCPEACARMPFLKVSEANNNA